MKKGGKSQGESLPEVTIYTRPGCPYCKAAKEDLTQRGLPYTEIDVEAEPRALEELLNLSGGEDIVPVIVEDDKVTVGFGGN